MKKSNTGTLIKILGKHGKSLKDFSAYPEEVEVLHLPNSEYFVALALHHEEAKLLEGMVAALPPNCDLLVLKQEPTDDVGSFFE